MLAINHIARFKIQVGKRYMIQYWSFLFYTSFDETAA